MPVFLKALGLFNFEHRKCRREWRKLSKLFTKSHKSLAICHTQVSATKFRCSGFQNISIITHGVLERKLSRPKRPVPLDGTVILSLFGFLGDYKGHEFAIAILELLPENFKLCFIGGRHPESGGEEIGNLLRMAADRGFTDRVLITGWVTEDEADRYQLGSHICIAPYQTSELSASGALTWALTSGLPIIASDINSFRAINKKRQALFLCHRTDRVEWVWAIKKITEDKSFAKRLVKGARSYCKENSWSNICKQHMELYRE